MLYNFLKSCHEKHLLWSLYSYDFRKNKFYVKDLKERANSESVCALFWPKFKNPFPITEVIRL